ncbi:MAG: phosphopantothenoylcysteine decarboxylase [Candidatus Omnitrophota bacterium]|nr:phosphopantothenoylcysteine decarboxylase [Candidatus Omnitrophota bacterium]
MRILITAGPTREFIDPVRFISNSSTGFLGYELAKAALRRGHKVTLISGPTPLTPPKGVKFVPVITALEMRAAVNRFYPSSDCLIMSAAVADYRPAAPVGKKIKKTKEILTVRLKKNPDILLEAGKKKGKRILVGFALETENLIANAKEKLRRKNLDFIVAASLRGKNNPFGDKKSHFVIISREGKVKKVVCDKRKLSNIIIDNAESIH